MTEDQKFHISAKRWGKPLAILAIHCPPSATLMLTELTLKLHQQRPDDTTKLRSATGSTFELCGAKPGDEGETEPALETWRFHSAILPLPEYRDVTVHLPPIYAEAPTRRFPVFYLHDGQNLFDGRLSYVAGRTWQAHTAADTLFYSGEIEPVILVGIANTGLRRMAEYTPTRDFRMSGGEGHSYGRLLIHEVKPFIDQTYRTRAGATDTAVGGSSLGGLITLYLGLQHPDVFGKLAILSPSVWWDHRSILTFLGHSHNHPLLKIWLDMGTAEGLRHLRDTDLLYQRLLKRGWRDGVDLAYMRDEGALHDEVAWAARFPNVLRFLFPSTEEAAL